MHVRKGLTLIEILVVISILSVISCVAVPCFGSLYIKGQSMLLETSSKELMTDLRLVQQMAKVEDTVYHIFFNKSDNSYMIYSYKDMNNSVYKSKKLPEGIAYDNMRSTFTNNKISFNSSGKPLPRPCTISLINKDGQYKRITITVDTDYISIKDI